MTKATFWHRGEAIDYKNGTNSIIEANTIVPISSRIGVVGTTIAPSEVGSLILTGIFEIPKKASEAIPLGALVFFDGSVITQSVPGNTPAGYAAASALAADANVLVKLLG